MRQLCLSYQETSRSAYRETLSIISERQRQVLDELEKGPATNLELAHRLGWEINRVTPRILELRTRGVVKERERRACQVTGRRAIVWESM